MSGHRARVDMAMQDVTRLSKTSGELLADRNEWGATYLISTATSETRKLAPPSLPGQRVVLTMTVDNGNCVVDAPAGQDFDGAGGDQATFADVGDTLVLESFYTGPSTLQWRVALNLGSVAIA